MWWGQAQACGGRRGTTPSLLTTQPHQGPRLPGRVALSSKTYFKKKRPVKTQITRAEGFEVSF